MQHRALYESYIQPLSPIPTDLTFTVNAASTLKSVLFDVYGTLFISASGDISTVQHQIVKNQQLASLLTKYHISIPVGDLIAQLTLMIQQTHEALKKNKIDYPEVNIDIIWNTLLKWDDIEKARAFAREYELIVNPVYPMPNLDKTLTYLNQKHIPLGIVSNAQFYTIDLFEYFLSQNISQLGFQPDLTFLSYQYHHAKPSTYLFESAADNLKKRGILADNVLYVGNDMLNDVYAAGSAGFRTALFAGDMRSLRLRKDMDNCKHIIPDIIITDLFQLADVL